MSTQNCLGEFNSATFDDLENSINLEEGSEGPAFKFKIFSTSKQFSRRIISIFQKKSNKMRKYQSMANLFSEIVDESSDTDGRETKKQKCRCQKEKSLERKPLHEYERTKRRKQQMSGDGAPSPPYSPSDNRKIDSNKKVLRSALKVANSPAVCKKKVSFAPLPCRIHSSPEVDLYESTDDESYVVPHRIFENENSFNSSVATYRDRSAANIPNTLTSLKFGDSSDSFTQLSANVRHNEMNPFSYNASEDHEEACRELHQELFSRSLNLMDGLKLARPCNSVNCIPSYVKPRLSTVNPVTDFVTSEWRKFA
ncbi:hypothetical protein QLX08_000019 [Tetragonisca angustula]